MTRQLLKERVAQIVGDDPRNLYETSDFTQFNQVIDARLSDFSARTLCRYNNDVAFTLTVGQSDYGLAVVPGAFAADIVMPVEVVIDGTALTDFAGRPGPVGLDEIAEVDPRYTEAPNAKPRHWVDLSANRRLLLYPAPDVAYANCSVAAFLRVPVLTTGPGIDQSLVDDATVIDVPETLQEAMVHWVAGGIVHPLLRAAEYQALLALAMPVMDRHKQHVLSRFSRVQTRGFGHGRLRRFGGR